MLNFKRVLLIVSLGIITSITIAQEVVELPITKTDPSIQWEGGERDFHSKEWNTRVVTNTSKPTMQVFRPANPNGAAMVICPGGALYAHSIDSEGEWVGKALSEAGITAFVLKYRLVPTGEGSRENLIDVPFEEMYKRASQVLPLAISDAHNAIRHVRSNAAEYQIDPNRIGLMGFSAGGAVTVGAAYDADVSAKPNFIAPVYFWENVQKIESVPTDAGPAFILCATDDPLDLAPASAKLYLSWIEAGKRAELHMYSTGGHGFGMRPMDAPVGDWMPRFVEWMEVEGLIYPHGFAAKFDHDALMVTDVNNSMDWYKDILGLKELPTPAPNPMIRWLSLGNIHQLHLIEVADFKLEKHKATHMSLAVGDINKFIQHLKLNGVPYEDWLGAKQTIANRPDGVQQIYIQDPDGYWIEINNAQYGR